MACLDHVAHIVGTTTSTFSHRLLLIRTQCCHEGYRWSTKTAIHNPGVLWRGGHLVRVTCSKWLEPCSEVAHYFRTPITQLENYCIIVRKQGAGNLQGRSTAQQGVLCSLLAAQSPIRNPIIDFIRRFCKYPQEFVLRLERQSKIQQIQILAHEYKVCRWHNGAGFAITSATAKPPELANSCRQSSNRQTSSLRVAPSSTDP